MTAKKKIPDLKINKKTETIQVIKNKEKESYKPIFIKPVVIKKIKKIDLNWFGIRQYLKNTINFDTFKKLKNKPVKEQPEKIEVAKEKFNYIKYYEEMNLVILKQWNKIFKR